MSTRRRVLAAVRRAAGLIGRDLPRTPPAGRCGRDHGPPVDGCRVRPAPARPTSTIPWPMSSHRVGEARWNGHRAARGRAAGRPAASRPSLGVRATPSAVARQRGSTASPSPSRRSAPPGRDHRRQRVHRRRLLALGHGDPGDGRLQLPDGGRLAAAGRTQGGCVVDPGDLLGGRTGHPHVPDAEAPQLRSDVGVGRAGDHPLDQVADLVGGGGRAAEGEPAVRVAEPELVVEDDGVVGLTGPGHRSWRRSMASTRTPASDSIAFCRYGGSASSRCRSIGPLGPGPDPPAGRAQHGHHDQQTGDHAGGLLPAEAAVAQLGGQSVDARRRRPAPGHRRRSAGTPPSRDGSRCRSAARRRPGDSAPPHPSNPVTAATQEPTTTARRGRRDSPTTAATQMTPKTIAPSQSGGRPGPTSRPISSPQTSGAAPAATSAASGPANSRPGYAIRAGHHGAQTSSGSPTARPIRPTLRGVRRSQIAPTTPRTIATRMSEGSNAVSPTSTTPAPQPPRHASGARGRRSTRPAQGQHQHRQQDRDHAEGQPALVGAAEQDRQQRVRDGRADPYPPVVDGRAEQRVDGEVGQRDDAQEQGRDEPLRLTGQDGRAERHQRQPRRRRHPGGAGDRAWPRTPRAHRAGPGTAAGPGRPGDRDRTGSGRRRGSPAGAGRPRSPPARAAGGCPGPRRRWRSRRRSARPGWRASLSPASSR